MKKAYEPIAARLVRAHQQNIARTQSDRHMSIERNKSTPNHVATILDAKLGYKYQRNDDEDER